MSQFLGDGLWAEISRLGVGPGPKLIVVPYYTDDSRVRCARGDVIIVDATKPTVIAGQTSAKVLLDAAKRGAEVYSHACLHAKIVVARGAAIVSSANLSMASANLREAGVVLTESSAVRAVEEYATHLRAEAVRLSMDDLVRLAALPVSTPVGAGLKKPSVRRAILEGLSAVLDTVTFSYSEGTPDLTPTQVEKIEAERARRLPKDWTFFESYDTRGVFEAVRKACTGRSLVEFRVRSDRTGQIVKFFPHERGARQLIDVFRAKRYVVSVFGPPNARTFLDLEAERRELAAQLTRGVQSAESGLVRRISNAAGLLCAKDLRTLCILGTNAG